MHLWKLQGKPLKGTTWSVERNGGTVVDGIPLDTSAMWFCGFDYCFLQIQAAWNIPDLTKTLGLDRVWWGVSAKGLSTHCCWVHFHLRFLVLQAPASSHVNLWKRLSACAPTCVLGVSHEEAALLFCTIFNLLNWLSHSKVAQVTHHFSSFCC